MPRDRLFVTIVLPLLLAAGTCSSTVEVRVPDTILDETGEDGPRFLREPVAAELSAQADADDGVDNSLCFIQQRAAARGRRAPLVSAVDPAVQSLKLVEFVADVVNSSTGKGSAHGSNSKPLLATALGSNGINRSSGSAEAAENFNLSSAAVRSGGTRAHAQFDSITSSLASTQGLLINRSNASSLTSEVASNVSGQGSTSSTGIPYDAAAAAGGDALARNRTGVEQSEHSSIQPALPTPWDKSNPNVSAPLVPKRMTWQAWAVFSVIIMSFTLLFLEPFPPHMVMLTLLVVVWSLGIITSRQAISGFSNEAVITSGALFIVVKAVDRSRLIDSIARKCLGKASSPQMATGRFSALVVLLGCFVNNTPLVALLMPIVKDWAQGRDLPVQKFLIPLAYSAMMGGTLTLTGLASNLLINGMMMDITGERFNFFDPARVGLPVTCLAAAYLFFCGQEQLPGGQVGRFETFTERTSEIMIALKIPRRFSLIGTSVDEALRKMLRSHIDQPHLALLKIFRLSPKRTGIERSVSVAGSPRGPEDPPAARAPTLPQSSSTPDLTNGIMYMRPVSRSPPRSPPVDDDAHLQTPELAGAEQHLSPSAVGLTPPRILGQQSRREIFPIPADEVLEAGDVLILGLPAVQCKAALNLAGYPVIEEAEDSDGEIESDSDVVSPDGAGNKRGTPARASLRSCTFEVSKVAGRKNRVAELVLSQTNPFAGQQLSGPVRHGFQQLYDVAILSIRHWSVVAGDPDSGQLGTAGGLLLGTKPERMWPGDTLLVLAENVAACNRLRESRDFLAVDEMVRDEVRPVRWLDYVPLILFLAGLVAVALNRMAMVKVSLLLVVLFVLGGWIEPSKLRDCIDVHLLMVMGSALGIAEAVKTSGLSYLTADLVISFGLGIRGTIFALYFGTMLMSEMVTSNAAAALSVPLALDFSRALGLASPKPLVMTVLLAAASSFANPVATPCCLMVFSAGGYSLTDFVKIGLPIDIIYWIGCCVLIPVMWL